MTEAPEALNRTTEIQELGRALALQLPPELCDVWSRPAPEEVESVLYRPLPGSEPPSLHFALAQLRRGAERPPRTLLPLHLVDTTSIACVVCAREGDEHPADFGQVVRWHLTAVPARAQRRPLDVDARSYVDAMVSAERGLAAGKTALAAVSDEYYESHVKAKRLPKAHERRPIRLACQNVVVGEAVWAYDARFDGLSVSVWQTSQEPHVNAHEGTRALTAMMLAEAFRSGGTMEVRFDDHPEHAVPALLRQWARCEGIALLGGARAIAPTEARQLIVAATEMSDELRRRVERLIAGGGLSVERVCYMLLAGIWRPLELTFLLGTSPRVADILAGGSDPLYRPRHQAERDLCRAAVMAGTLLARLEQPPNEQTTAIEDYRNPITWTVDDEGATIRFSGLVGALPWRDREVEPASEAIVLPRPYPDTADYEQAQALAGAARQVAILTPKDVERLPAPGVAHLRHPDRLSVIDRGIAARLLESRVGRR
jgi:hypothetical protein